MLKGGELTVSIQFPSFFSFVMQKYNSEILRILVEAGNEGLSVKKIARHVHNACNTLFSSVSFDEVYTYVSQYLIRNSRNADSMIARTDVRGNYRINPRNEDSQQLMLRFQDECDEKEDAPKPSVDQSLSLFEDL